MHVQLPQLDSPSCNQMLYQNAETLHLIASAVCGYSSPNNAQRWPNKPSTWAPRRANSAIMGASASSSASRSLRCLDFCSDENRRSCGMTTEPKSWNDGGAYRVGFGFWHGKDVRGGTECSTSFAKFPRLDARVPSPFTIQRESAGHGSSMGGNERRELVSLDGQLKSRRKQASPCRVD